MYNCLYSICDQCIQSNAGALLVPAMPSRALESVRRVDEASGSLRPDNPRRWTSIEVGHQHFVATPRKRVSATTTPLASPVNKSPTAPLSSGNPPRNVNPSTTDACAETYTGLRTRSARPSPTSRPLSVPLLSGAGSYFLPQPGASGFEARSPANKRAPASRSSHGIETSNGPPPALSTQRSYSTEDAWRYPASIDQLALRPQLTHRALQSLAAGTTSRTNSSHSTIRLADVSLDNRFNPEFSENTSNPRRDIPTDRSEMSATTLRLSDQDPSEPNQDRTIRISDGTAVAAGGEKGRGIKERGKARLSQEDLFLDLAHADVSMQDTGSSLGRIEHQRPHIAVSDPRQPFPLAHQASSTLSARPPSGGRSVANQEGPPMVNGRSPQWYQFGQSEYTDSPTPGHQQVSRDRIYAASAHPLDHRTRSRVASNTPKATFRSAHGALHGETAPESDPPAKRHRRLSITDDVQTAPRAYKQSNLSYPTSGLYNSSPLTGRSEYVHGQSSSTETPHIEETESTASLTAPSTVWDELDDLKSRIRKLELTGKLPSSSGAAMTNAAMANNIGERPHTATTTATTISSSPKGARPGSISPDKCVVEVHGVHPLLRTALAKAQPFVRPNIYKALEATASDALTLASMTGTENSQVGLRGPGSVVAGSSSSVDRQLRRKADSMCRSLTELCIALSDEPLYTETVGAVGRPGSRNSIMSRRQRERSVEKRIGSRETSQEPEIRPASRLMSRLEARRTSMLGLSQLNPDNDSPRRSPENVATPTPAAPAPTSRLERTSSILQNSRPHDEEDATTTRAPSRAMTEIRPPNRNRHSRDYTPQHALPSPQPRAIPSPQPRSPPLAPSIPARKNYFGAAPATPATQAQPGLRRYMERTAPSSADAARLAEARQQRLASLEQLDVAGRQRARSFGTLGAMAGFAREEADGGGEGG